MNNFGLLALQTSVKTKKEGPFTLSVILKGVNDPSADAGGYSGKMSWSPRITVTGGR